MLDAQTKRRIDNARDILVGKVPDPKSQVEQITFALIYKFMDDMDQLSVSIGGDPSFFTNGYEQFAWSKLMDKRLGGEARLDLYVRALDQMSQNPYIPQLFRDIFKGAFLPYRDGETLNLFLKEANGFSYTHSEDLGDAYEYLLAIFASQGKAGQFRTPRHIIDFIVDCVNPGKDDTVLDPACGTAGFLISAYKHILQAQTQTPLSPDEKKRLTENLVGYDIAPDMVRLSRVNMYLHRFPNPTIHEYDTLTTEDRWDENFDVILANPPFMTPKGGIRPHKRFAVRANRSEVLFVDYIAEHLNPGGRAGVIVPEGIIFQSNNAYKALRKMLVEENYLYAVVSLPAGIFNPYSGVKTSILLMDKNLARQSDSVLFLKVAADGYDLGAQRREIERNDVPEALRMVRAFQADPSAQLPKSGLAQLVSKRRLAEDGEYNLSAERYRINGMVKSKWPMVELGSICQVERGTSITKDQTILGNIPVIAGGQQPAYYHNIANRNSDIITVSASGAYAGFVNFFKEPIYASDCTTIKSKNESTAITYFVYQVLKNNQDAINTLRSGMAQPHVYAKDLVNLLIPLPPIEAQREIVEEIEGYQKVIDGARQVVQNYKPIIPIDPSWPMIELGKLLTSKNELINPNDKRGSTIYIGLENIESNTGRLTGELTENFSEIKSAKKVFHSGDILYGKLRPNLNKVHLTHQDGICSTDILVLNGSNSGAVPDFYATYIRSESFNKLVLNGLSGSQLPRVSWNYMSSLHVPEPPIAIQKDIALTLVKEQEAVNANFYLINKFESKISNFIEQIWINS